MKKKKSTTKKKTVRPTRSRPAAAAVTVPAAPPPEQKKPKAPATPQTPRGMKDILPVDEKYWRHVERSATSLAEAHGFHRIETPIVEETSLFVRGVGKQTDIVEKEMFSFVDQGGDQLSLRPEGTAPVVRAYINHGMLNLPQPVKLWYSGPMFRHERPQGGRLRQFHQWSLETVGDEKPIADAELVLIAVRFFRQIGLPVTVEINSIGDGKCRPAFVEKLVAYYRAHRTTLCETCKLRLNRNPLRLLDCKEPGCIALKAGAPQITDHLCDDCKNHFIKVLEFLDDVDVSYTLNPFLVRGLDYYTRTVFEIAPVAEEAAAKAQSSLASGGRYDGLTEALGGRPTPAVGFSIGLERVIGRLKEDNLPVPDLSAPQVYFAQLGEPAKKKALMLFEEIRLANIPVLSSFTKDALKAQMEIAAGLGVRYVVILGQKEIMDGTVIVRDMDAGVQEIVDQKRIVTELKKKIGMVHQEETMVLPPVKVPEEIAPREISRPPRAKAAPLAAMVDDDEEALDPLFAKPSPEEGIGEVGLADAGEDKIESIPDLPPGDDLGPPAGLIEEEP